MSDFCFLLFYDVSHVVLPNSHEWQTCNQDIANITVGIWIALTSVTCILAAQKIKPIAPSPSDDSDPILIEDQTSPVGYKVVRRMWHFHEFAITLSQFSDNYFYFSQPNFPDFQIDPVLFGGNGLATLNTKTTTALGLLIGIGAGAFVVSSGLYDYMQHVDSLIEY